MPTRPKFTPGRNIALKVPAHEHTRMVAFYRDILGLALIPEEAPSTVPTSRHSGPVSEVSP